MTLMVEHRKCTTCRGEYLTHNADGTEYYHRCAPVFDPALRYYVARPDERNENVVAVEHGAGTPTAAGLGVTVVKSFPLADVAAEAAALSVSATTETADTGADADGGDAPDPGTD